MFFKIIGDIAYAETFAVGSGIRELARLRKGIARVKLEDGSTHLAEVHWNEASGLGKFEFKIKHFL